MTMLQQASQGGTVADLLLTAIHRDPERSAFANAEATLSDRALGETISRIAQHFDRLGLQPGDTVAQLGVNRCEVFAIAAAPASPARLRQALQVLGPILLQSYGQTEAPNALLILNRQDHAGLDDAQLAAAGRPSPLMQLRLLDDQGQEVTDGARGEICVRGPMLMSGYLNRAAETAAALAGGWLHTGDIAYQGADGLYDIVDRKKDLIISGGFNVHPKEIEDAICNHPAVATAAVIGVPDDKWGELVMADVQLKPGAAARGEEIMALVREAKGAVAAPKRVELIPALPLTALGKTDKKALRARHWSAGERAVH